MDEIRQWAIAVCFTVSTVGIISILIPENSIGKLIKFISSIVVMMAFLVPFSSCNNMDIQIDREQVLRESEEISQRTKEINQDYVYDMMNENIYVIIEEALANLGVEAESIQVNLSEHGDDVNIHSDITLDKIYVSAQNAISKKLEEMKITSNIYFLE